MGPPNSSGAQAFLERDGSLNAVLDKYFSHNQMLLLYLGQRTNDQRRLIRMNYDPSPSLHLVFQLPCKRMTKAEEITACHLSKNSKQEQKVLGGQAS